MPPPREREREQGGSLAPGSARQGGWGRVRAGGCCGPCLGVRRVQEVEHRDLPPGGVHIHLHPLCGARAWALLGPAVPLHALAHRGPAAIGLLDGG